MNTVLSPPRMRKPRGKGHERRAEILAAAKRMFVTGGYEAFTTRRLAAEVGLSQTGLYVYFKGKEGIFDAVCRQSFDELAADFRAVEAGETTGFERLRAITRAYVAFGLSHPDEYRLTFMDGPGLVRLTDIDPRVVIERPFDEQTIANQTFLMLRRTLQACAAEGLLKPMDMTVAAHFAWFSLHGLVSVYIARPRFLKADREALVEATIQGVIDALKA